MSTYLFEAVRQAGRERMVAKRRRSQYAGTLNEDWLKVKYLRIHDFVVGGWVPNSDKKTGALLLSEFVDGDLRYLGQVGSQSARVMRAVARVLRPCALRRSRTRLAGEA